MNIPVKLFSAANSSSAISFRLLSKDGHKLKQQYVDPKDDDRVVPRSEMVKGYEFAKDQYVLFEEAELKEMQEKATGSIDIQEFVPEDRIPKVFYAKTYYLGPDKGGDRAYKLLSEAMRVTGRCGLATYAARGKMYLVLVAPMGDGGRDVPAALLGRSGEHDEVPLGDADPKEAEVGLAVQLIDQIANDRFEPEKYRDEVKIRIEAAIQRKIDGQSVTEAAPEPEKAQIIDLMQALKASLDGDDDAAAAPEPEPAESPSPSENQASEMSGSNQGSTTGAGPEVSGGVQPVRGREAGRATPTACS